MLMIVNLIPARMTVYVWMVSAHLHVTVLMDLLETIAA